MTRSLRTMLMRTSGLMYTRQGFRCARGVLDGMGGHRSMVPSLTCPQCRAFQVLFVLLPWLDGRPLDAGDDAPPVRS